MSLRHLGSANDPQLLRSMTSVDADVADGFSPGFTGLGVVKGQKVATKKYLTNGSELVVKDREDLLLLKSVRKLKRQRLTGSEWNTWTQSRMHNKVEDCDA